MEVGEEDTGPQLKDIQIGYSWIPATPVKPDLTKQQPICTPVDVFTPENVSGSGHSQQETQCKTVPAWYNSSNPPSNGDNIFKFNKWHEIEVLNSHVDSHVYGDSPMEKLGNMSFANLLALADAGAKKASVENVLTDFVSMSSTCLPFFRPRVGESQFTPPGTSFDTELNIENACMDGSSNPSRPIFDLNALPRKITAFEPITPEKTNKAESDMKELSVNEPQLQENHKLDKRGAEEIDLIRTPQQKPRRKKHRPKVVIEGQHTKSSVRKTSTTQETTRVKRRYVRRKGVNNSLGEETNGTDLNQNTPSSTQRKRNRTDECEGDMDKGTTETKEVEEALVRSRSSCRRSLNFNSEGQARDECSIYDPSLNCNRELQAENFNAKDQSGTELCEEVMKNGTGVNHLEDLRASIQQHAPNMDDHNTFTDQTTCTRGKCQIVFSDVTHDKEANIVQVKMNSNGQRTPEVNDPIGSMCSSTSLNSERPVRGLKRQNMSTSVAGELPNRNEFGAFYNSLQAYLPVFLGNADMKDATPGFRFPTIYKKKRTEKGHNMVTSNSQYVGSTSANHAPRDSCSKLFIATTNQGSASFQCQVSNMLSTKHATDGTTQNGRQVFEDLLALGPTEKIKRRRSKGNTRLRDLASLQEICRELPAPSRRAEATRIEQNAQMLHEPHTCMEALAADTRSTMMTKKRSRRSPLNHLTVQKMYNHQKSATISTGKPLAITWKNTSPIDSIIEQFNQLDLNVENSRALAPYQNGFMTFHTQYQEQSLVPFQRCGDVVPFDNLFAQARRRKPRPKVDLDDETTRVWKLLLENINSEGIDGTDEEKTKWWEEERRVFCGRADSFIARMHMVQGDRRFSPWKGSVVDSVVGVFLTQNVSDHLSSSAFMSLAAHFPLKSKIGPEELHEDGMATHREEPEVFVLDSEEPFGLNKEVLNQSVSGEDTKLLQDFEDGSIREVNSAKSTGYSFDDSILKDNFRDQSTNTIRYGTVMSQVTVTNKSTSLIDDERDAEDSLSSQSPEISSQNSADSPVAQTTERSGSCLLSTSEEPAIGVKPDRFATHTSFVKLLQIAGTVLQDDNINGRGNNMADENLQMLSESSAVNLQNEVHSDNPTFPAETITSCSDSACCRVLNFRTQMTQGDLSQNNNVFFEKELCAAETSELSSESAIETSLQNITAASIEERPKSSIPNIQSSNSDRIDINQKRAGTQTGLVSGIQENNYEMQKVSDIPIYPQNLMDITGSSSIIDNSKSSEHKEVNSKNDPGNHSGKMVNGTSAKGGRPRKEKGDPVDWDNLRRQAQPGGKERAKTANTMDSVDWDAVRCADVDEVAQTIKERGMNNMLAERIKDFLNRLVRDHGSIDLEWLRDVPPDKAKEYLLSIRGLGLKSVECVRLLTLHHLAFPVDTNVGRIAVRLGWVPLQPLPESLQLHLLELYPVMESIQKYLWPRLCKLDQRTLYELHYQMITFGKVFCTKNKPNCNACPLRAECRHFASAFASSRLALPAPEERSIVSATESRTCDQNPMRSMNTLQLPSPQASQIDITCVASSSQPIIEEPPSPEPIIEIPATPEPCYTQVPECDIEDALSEDPDEIPTIQLNMEEFTHNLQKIIQQNTELQESDMSKALVALTSEAASIPVPKLKNKSRLRTEHRVYELPDSHPLLEGMDKREPDDPCPYLLAIWAPGETVDSTEPPERRCSSQGPENLCSDETCLSCNSIREANSQTVRGTILIPCRTAMRGSFPLNGTYFQVNEVFTDHESSLSPIDVPREWLWNLSRRTVFFGTSIPTIFKGLTTEGIQFCFWRGFVCVRGFDRKSRAPRPLTARMHFPESKLAKTKGKAKVYDKET